MTTDFAPQSGDMDKADFRRHAYRLVDWIADYLDHSDRYPVLANVTPARHRRCASNERPRAR